MRVFTKVNGQLLVWEVTDVTASEAIQMVKDELGPDHKNTVLALVKY
jgi:hypothetical protein